MDSFRKWLEEQNANPDFCAEYDRLHEEYEAARTNMTLEESFAGLDQMLAKLEDSSLPLEEALKLYQQGMELLTKCNDKIDLVEKQIMEVNGEGELSEF